MTSALVISYLAVTLLAFAWALAVTIVNNFAGKR